MTLLPEPLGPITQEEHRYHFTSRPSICPYVCSTKKDFQEERSYLTHIIFPQLDHLCFTRGSSFKAVDLKWPLEEIQKNILPRESYHLYSEQLKLSLDYISNSSPFFICILGQTYGEFVPEPQQCFFPRLPDPKEFSNLSNVEQNMVVAANNGYPWVLEGTNRKRSLTELEINQAVFLSDHQYQYFYFRDYDYVEKKLQDAKEHEKELILSTFANKTEYEESMIWELKVKIVDKGLPVRFFKTKEDLGNLVLKDWYNVIDKLHPVSTTPTDIGHEHNLEKSYHEAFAEKLCKDFAPSEPSKTLLMMLDTFASSAATSSVSSAALKSIFLLNGERGCGKSTLVAEWLRIFRANNPEVMVVSYFVGSSGRSSDIMTFMRYCITELQGRYFGIQNEDFYSYDNICDMWSFPLVVEAFVASLTLKPCVLLLDGAEELSAIHGLPAEQAKGFTWLPSNLPNHCKIILTTTASHLSYKYIKERCDVHIADILKISDESTRLSIFQKQLPMSDRFIPTEQLKEILNHKRKVSPLQLAVLASELSSCGIYTNKLDCLENYLDTLSMEQLWSLVIQRWAVDYSWACERKEKKKNRSSITELHSTVSTVMEGWVVDVLCLLCISRCGLSDHDILQLLKLMGYRQHLEVTPLHWASFRAATSKWIQEKPDGLLHIRHRYICDVIEHLLLGAVIPINESLDNSINKSISRKQKRIHQLLIKYFLQLDFSRRVYEELPWHLVMIGNKDELHRFLSDTRTVDLISRNMSYGCQMKMELIHYWQILSSSGKDPAAEYQMTTSEITEGGNNLYRILFFVAQCLKDFGKIKEAENVFLSIESHLITSMYEKSKMEVLLWTQKYLGDFCCELGSLQDAYMYYKKALANLQSLGPGDLENKKLLKFKGRLMCHLAVLDARMFPGQRNKMLEDTIRHYELFQPTPYEQATIKLAQGLNKFSDGDFSKAEKYFSECLDIRCKLYGKKHILCGEVQECLADLEYQKRNNQYSHRIRALNYYTAVIEIKVAFEALTKSVSAKQNLQLSLSNTLLKAGKLLNQTDLGGSKEAIGLLQRSLDLRTSVVGHDHHLSLEVQSILKEVKSASPINKEHFGYQQFNSIQRPKSVQHYKRFDNFLSIINNHDTTLNKAPALNNINSLNQTDGAKDNFLSQCSINQEHSMQTLLSTRNIMCVHGKSSLLYKEEKKNPQKAETILVSQALTLSGRKPTSERIAIVFRPASVYSASMTGPLSTIASLAPLNRPKSSSDIDKFIHKAAWYHVPGRYTTLDVSFPPKRNQLRNKAKMN